MCSSGMAPNKFFPILILSAAGDVSCSTHTIYTVIISKKINHVSILLCQLNVFDIKEMPSGCFKLWKVRSPELELCKYSEYLDAVSKFKTDLLCNVAQLLLSSDSVCTFYLFWL